MVDAEEIKNKKVKEDKKIEEKKVEDKKETPKKNEPREDLKGSLAMKLKAHVLRTVVDALLTTCNEAKLSFMPQGIETKVVDPAHVSMVKLELESKACEEYKAETFDVGVDLDKLDSLLKLAKADDLVTLEYNTGAGKNENALYVKFRELVRRVGCLAIEGMPDTKIPNLEFTIKAMIDAEKYKLGLKACEQLSDHFALMCNKDTLEIFAEGDVDFVSLKYKKADLPLLEATGDKTRALYSLDFVLSQLKTAKSDTQLTIKFSEYMPMSLYYEFADGFGKLSYLTAPRIETD